jgi:hypothetical protein
MRDTLPFALFLAAVGRYRERRRRNGLGPADHAVIRAYITKFTPSQGA